ncbi:MAG: pyruvate dehydrogenase complex E1 component subunit beta [Rhodospirillaceae bacterium]|nr:pyruvate dehydrogenase complex E1 component subunit beta [Rhodospirillaceae bacterium]MYB13578.1 pyruvate dehydrogenase complex E1 component subunit beta [Rhodospirillaceae bacterium]MYI50690.1 pyruvate dehydrogenase complex E1 component subunit beta [Rhodospirillaceae bacterium]
MPIEVLMPALSPTMEEGTLARWLVEEGDSVSAGDVIAEIETDKATMEVEAVDEGVVGRLAVAEGTEGVKVNAVIAWLLEEGEDASAIDVSAPAAASAAPVRSADEGADAGAAESPAAPAPAAPAPAAEAAYAGETKEVTVREALRDAMAEEMRRDDRVFLMGEEVAEYQGAYKVSQGLLDEFGAGRVIDTPITEHGFAGLGTGAAFAGLRPIVEFMTFNFAMQAIDHIINSAAKTRYMSGGQVAAPIVFRGPNGAAARVAAQHSQEYSSWYAHCPGLKVVAPWSAADAKGLLKAAIRDDDPVVFLENEILYGRSGEAPADPEHIVPIGRANVVREGADVTITSFSLMMETALEAAEMLEKDGIAAEVIDLRTIRPLDTATVIASVKKTNRLVSVEEGWPFAGIGAELCAVAMEQAFDDLDAPVARVCGADVPMPYAANLEKLALPDAQRVVQAVRAVCYAG